MKANGKSRINGQSSFVLTGTAPDSGVWESSDHLYQFIKLGNDLSIKQKGTQNSILIRNWTLWARNNNGSEAHGFNLPVPPPPPPPATPRRDPLALDLNGNGIEVTNINDAQKTLFDHSGTGIKIATSLLKPEDGWLVRDLNHNNKIDDGTELFGIATLKKNGQLASSGFDALADLMVWQDNHHHGISEAGELFTLDQISLSQNVGINPDLPTPDQSTPDQPNNVGRDSSRQGIQSISLVSNHQFQETNGTTLHGTTQVTFNDGHHTQMADVTLANDHISGLAGRRFHLESGG